MEPQVDIGPHQAVILAADVAGPGVPGRADAYSTATRLQTADADIFAPAVARHGGTVVQPLHDGARVEFATATAAVNCAVEIQEALEQRNAGMPPEQKLELRIGIHAGDIAVDQTGVHGDAALIAERLEGLDRPGGICISAAVLDEVAQATPFVYASLGTQHLASIDRPVTVYHLVAEPDPAVPGNASVLRRPTLLLAFTVLIALSAWWTWTLFYAPAG